MAIHTRRTRQKDAIREAFLRADRPLSPEEVRAEARVEVPGLSLATVYRNIGALVDEHWLEALEFPGQSTRFEVAGKAHHHHFQCTACRKTFELAGCEIVPAPILPAGFKVTGHEFFLYGLCAGCQ